MKTKHIYLWLIACLLPLLSIAQNKNSSMNIFVKNPTKIYIGAVLDSTGINQKEHQFITLEKPDLITVSSNLPVRSMEFLPTAENMVKAVQTILEKTGTEMNNSFAHKRLPIKSLKEVYKLFGQQIDTEYYFGFSAENLEKKTFVGIDIEQIFLTLDMDFPPDGILHHNDPTVQKNIDKLIYVGSVSYGRKATILVESNYDYEKINATLATVFSREKLSEEQKHILATAKYHSLLVGVPHMPMGNPQNFLLSVIETFSKPFSKTDYGVPLTFSASYVKDNSLFNNYY